MVVACLVRQKIPFLHTPVVNVKHINRQNGMRAPNHETMPLGRDEKMLTRSTSTGARCWS